MRRVVEIRSYTLKPNTRDQFHRLVREHSMPMLERWTMDVVAYGPSLHEENAYFLMRSFASVDDLQQQEDAFYGSDEWRQGPREAIIALIDTTISVIVEVDEAALAALRGIGAGT
jgi:hypothetical protein